MMILPKVIIYTDGACYPNPGRGGWAALLQFTNKYNKLIEKELSGYEHDSTNNRMELFAAISGLEALTKPCQVILYSDSKLLVKGASLWMYGWKRYNWTRKNGPLINKELWQRLHAATESHNIMWKWIKAHNGHVENERVDALAVAARLSGTRGLALTHGG
jgi:ribonuclease HI